MSGKTYTEVGGVEWCVTHQGILDECDDRDGYCDMAEKCSAGGGVGRETCDIRALYVEGGES